MKKPVFIALSLSAVLLLSAEAAVRLTHADARLMRPLLRYHMNYEVQAFRPSRNPGLIYELAPDAAAKLPGDPTMTTNSLGFRDRRRTPKKPAGVCRIICLGGDFVYGTEVNNQDTFPYQLEQLLNKKYAGHFEVWNAGIRNGTLTYQTVLARQIAPLYTPDLLLFQTGDTGPRAFLPNMNLPYYFAAHRELFVENLRFLPFPKNSFWKYALDNCALYRFAVVFLNNCILINRNNPLFQERVDASDTLNLMHLEEFFSEQQKVPALIFKNFTFDEKELDALPSTGKELRPRLASCYTPQYLPPHAPQEYLLTRPPAHVFRWYASCMAKELEKRGYIKKK